MMKVRQDAWLQENDEILAQAVIRHVKEGSTQLNAFEEASDALNRTAAACGFRWNAVVRRMYEEELAAAKQIRKERTRVLGVAKRRNQATFFNTSSPDNATSIPLSALSIEIVIAYLMRLQHGQANEADTTKWRQIAQVQAEKIEQLGQEIQQLQNENTTIKADYEQFVQIMNRARKLVVLDSVEERSAPTFKMERNGNLIPTTTTDSDLPS